MDVTLSAVLGDIGIVATPPADLAGGGLRHGVPGRSCLGYRPRPLLRWRP